MRLRGVDLSCARPSGTFAADDGGERALRLRDGAVEVVELLLQEEARDRGR